jgi:sugar lactone lactonase YvrE
MCLHRASILSFFVVIVFTVFSLSQPTIRQIAGFRTPESVAVGPDGNYYVSNIGSFNEPNDGAIKQITLNGDSFAVKDFATELNNPAGTAFFGKDLYVADTVGVWKIDPSGNKTVFLSVEKLPVPPGLLNDLAFDKEGNLYLSDTFRSLVYRVTPKAEVSIALDKSKLPELSGPNGLAVDDEGNLYVVDLNLGRVFKVTPAGEASVIMPAVGAGDGIAFDKDKNIYVSDFLGGRVLKLDPKGEISVFATGLTSPADITIDKERGWLVVPEFDANRITLISLGK